MSNTLIKNCCTLNKSCKNALKHNICIAITDDRITYIGDEADYVEDRNDVSIINANNAIALPGFVNAHTHIPMTLLRSAANDVPLKTWLEDKIWPLEAKLDNDMVYWGSMLGAAEMLSCGVTSIKDMYFMMDSIAKAVEKSGIRACLDRGIIGTDNDGGSLDEVEAVHERWHEAANGRIKIGIAPHAEYTCSPKVIKACVDRAEKLGCGLHIHVSETELEHQECIKRHGMTPTKLFDKLGALNENTTLAHGVFLDSDDIGLIAKRQSSVVHCPGSNLILASGIAPVFEMLEKGVNVALGTDGAASNNNLSVWEEMHFAALLQKGVTHDATAVTADQAIDMATICGARAISLSDEIGSLETGKKADLILIDFNKLHYWPITNAINHIVYCGKDSDVMLTMVNGQIVYENGEFKLFDINEIKDNIDRITKKLFE